MTKTRSEYARGKFDRTPPQNIEAERAVLGAMLLNPDAVGAGIEILCDTGDQLFYHEPHQYIYDAILHLFAASQPIDAITLIDQLKRAHALDKAGGAQYLAELTRAVPTSANVEVYARIVLDAAVLRNIITTGTRIVTEAYAGNTPANEMRDHAEQAFFAIANHAEKGAALTHCASNIHAAIAAIEHMASEGGLQGMPTGIAPLDDILQGLKLQEFVILAARPSVGKTACSLQIANHVALHLNKPVFYFSLEMSESALLQRLLIMEGGIDSARLKSGFLARQEIPKVHEAAQRLSTAPLYIDDTPGITAMQIRAKVRRLAARTAPPALVIIDYLQIMGHDGPKAERRDLEIAENCKALLALRKEFNCCVMVLCQLSREAEKGENAHPRLGHLRESGAIEQDSDVVVMLSKLPPLDDTPHGLQRIRVAVEKYRNGATGVCEVHFYKPMQQWRTPLPRGTQEPAHAPQPSRQPQQHRLPYNDPPLPEYEEDDMAF